MDNIILTNSLGPIHLPIAAGRMNAWDTYPTGRECDVERPKTAEYIHHVCANHDVFIFWRRGESL